MTWDEGCVETGPGGSFTNAGTWHVSVPTDDDWTLNDPWAGQGSRWILINTGDLLKEGAGRIAIDAPAINTGNIQVNSGDIRFDDGDATTARQRSNRG